MGVVVLLCKVIEEPLEQEVLNKILAIKYPLEAEVHVALKDPKVLLERLVQWDLLEAEVEARGEKGAKGDSGGVGQQGSIGPRGSTGLRCKCAKGLRGVAGIQGPLGMQGPVGSTGGQGERGLKGDKGIQGSVGAKCDRGERGERGVKGEKGIQGDNSDVLSVLVDHLRLGMVKNELCQIPCIRGYFEYHRIVWRYGNVT